MIKTTPKEEESKSETNTPLAIVLQKIKTIKFKTLRAIYYFKNYQKPTFPWVWIHSAIKIKALHKIHT